MSDFKIGDKVIISYPSRPHRSFKDLEGYIISISSIGLCKISGCSYSLGSEIHDIHIPVLFHINELSQLIPVSKDTIINNKIKYLDEKFKNRHKITPRNTFNIEVGDFSDLSEEVNWDVVEEEEEEESFEIERDGF